MAKQAVNLSLMLVKSQAAFGTTEASLTSANLIETLGPPKMSDNWEVTEVNNVAGSFSQDPSVPGPVSVDITATVNARSGGADTPGQYGTLLELSGMTKTEDVNGTFVYSFTSTAGSITDGTVWGYSGNLDASGCILRKAQNVIFSPKWTFEAGKPTVAEFTGKGRLVGIPAVGTSPAISKAGTVPYAFIGATTLTINGSANYKVISGEIDPSQEVALIKDPSATYGYLNSLITERKIKWKFKVYRDIPSVVDPETALSGKTTGALTIEYGTVPQKIAWSITSSQITKCTDSDEDGAEAWDLEGLAVNNTFTHTLTTI
jgi:hypothetical protein